MSRNLSYALTGWIAGLVTTVVMGLVWPIIFPAIINVENYYGDGPGMLTIMAITAAIMTPASIVGGIIGGRVSKEGGEAGRRVIAVIFAALFTVPVGVLVFLFFTGYGFGF